MLLALVFEHKREAAYLFDVDVVFPAIARTNRESIFGPTTDCIIARCSRLSCV